MIDEASVYKIGIVTRVHGIRGEVSMTFTDDVWDRAEAAYLILRIEGILVPFFLESYRFRSDTVALLKFQDYEDANTAEELCGAEVYFPHDLTPVPTDEDEYTWRYFTGFRIIDTIKGELGVIDQVDDSTANILFCIRDWMIPAADDFIMHIDHRERTITMQLPEGILDL